MARNMRKRLSIFSIQSHLKMYIGESDGKTLAGYQSNADYYENKSTKEICEKLIANRFTKETD